MKTAALILTILMLAGCGASQQLTRPTMQPASDGRAQQAAPLQNMGYARQAACWWCLKPANETEAVYLRNVRNTLNQLLGDAK